jgi:ATP-dependent DNA helicase RecQ
VVENAETFLYREIKEVPLKSPQPSSKKVPQALSNQDASVFSNIKALRLKLAKQNNIPAYVVFSDATLIDMVTKRPVTREEMLGVNGVGPGKLEKYGDLFLETLSKAWH